MNTDIITVASGGGATPSEYQEDRGDEIAMAAGGGNYDVAENTLDLNGTSDSESETRGDSHSTNLITIHQMKKGKRVSQGGGRGLFKYREESKKFNLSDIDNHYRFL
jgi:hypothetical protein